jgi:hypothetical protein
VDAREGRARHGHGELPRVLQVATRIANPFD